MWLMRNDAFLSLVAHRTKPGTILVRARQQEHLQILREWLTTQGVKASIRTEFPSDYPYRLEVSQVLMATFAYESVMGVDYDNFKNSVEDKPYHDALMKVWGAMRSLTPRSVQNKNDRAYDAKYPRYKQWWEERTPMAVDLPEDWDDQIDQAEADELYGSIHDLTDEQVARIL